MKTRVLLALVGLATGFVVQTFAQEKHIEAVVTAANAFLASLSTSQLAVVKYGVFSNQPELLGTIRYAKKSVEIDRAAGSWWYGFRSVLGLGMQHIAEGTDHLLFLLVLLLPAPLIAAKGRWGAFGGVRHGVLQLVKVVPPSPLVTRSP